MDNWQLTVDSWQLEGHPASRRNLSEKPCHPEGVAERSESSNKHDCRGQSYIKNYPLAASRRNLSDKPCHPERAACGESKDPHRYCGWLNDGDSSLCSEWQCKRRRFFALLRMTVKGILRFARNNIDRRHCKPVWIVFCSGFEHNMLCYHKNRPFFSPNSFP